MAIADPNTPDVNTPQSATTPADTPVPETTENVPTGDPGVTRSPAAEDKPQDISAKIDEQLAQASAAISSHNPEDHPNQTSPMDHKAKAAYEQDNSPQAQAARLEKELGYQGGDTSGADTSKPAWQQSAFDDDTDASNAQDRMQTDQAKGLINAVGGAAKTVEDIGHGVLVGLHSAETWLASKGIGRGDLLDPSKRVSLTDALTPKGATVGNPMAHAQAAAGSMALNLAAFGAAGGLSASGSLMGLAKGTAASAALSFASHDPNEEQLVDSIGLAPHLAEPIAAFLSKRPGDTDFEARFKAGMNSVLGDVGLAAAFHGALGAYRALRWGRVGQEIEGAAKALPQAAKEAEAAGTEAARVGEGVGPSGASVVNDSEMAAQESRIAVQDSKPAAEITAEEATARAGEPQKEAPGMPLGAPVQGETVATRATKLVDFDPAALEEGADLDSKLAGSKINFDGQGTGLGYSNLGSPDVGKAVVGANKDFFSAIEKSKTIDDITKQGAAYLRDNPTFYRTLETGKTLEDYKVAALNIAYNRLSATEAEARSTLANLAARGEEASVEAMNEYQAVMKETQVAFLAKQTSAQANARGLMMTHNIGDLDPVTAASKDFQDTLLKFNGGMEKNMQATLWHDAYVRQGDPKKIEELTKSLSKSQGMRYWDMVIEAKRSIMLMGINGGVMFENMGQLAFSVAEGLVVGGARDIGLLPQVADDMTRITGGQAWARAKGAIDGFTEATSAWLKDAREMAAVGELRFPKPLRGPTGDPFMDLNHAPAITAANAGCNPGTGMAKMVDYVGDKIRTGNKLVIGADDFAKFANHRMELSGYAHRVASDAQAAGGDYKTAFQEFMKNPPEEYDTLARETATENTFQKQSTGFVKSVEDAINKTEPGQIIGKLLAPFVRISGNLIQMKMEMTPGAQWMSSRWREAMQEGGAVKEKMMARAAVGGTFFTGALGWALAGNVTGAGPANAKARMAWLDAGNQPYSFRTHDGGDWHSFNAHIGPVSSVMKIAADLHDIGQYAINKGDYEQAAWAAIATAATNFTPEFLTDTFTKMGEAIATRDSDGAGKLLATQATSFIPPFVKSIRKMTDDTKRVARGDSHGVFSSMWADVKNNLPYFSTTLAPAQNIFGQDLTLARGVSIDQASATYNAKDSPAMQEMLRMQQTGPILKPDRKDGDAFLTLSMPSRTISRSVGGVPASTPLTPDEYHQLVRYSAGLDIPSAEPLQEHLDKFVQQPGYMQASDAMKQRLIAKQVAAYHTRGTQYFLSKSRGVMLKLVDQANIKRQNLLGGPNGQPQNDGADQ